MGVRRWLLIGLILSLCSTLVQAEVYRWKDASGRVIYGDNPPEGNKSAPLDLPQLTISDGLKTPEAAKAETEKPKAENTTPPPSESEQPKKDFKYESFEVATPQKDEAIRANDGTINITLKVEPSLQPNHSIILYMDGKQIADGTGLSHSIPQVERGTHTVFAVIKSGENDIILNTEVTTFYVLRAKKKRKLNTTEEETSTSS